jgi:hypothetical protein
MHFFEPLYAYNCHRILSRSLQLPISGASSGAARLAVSVASRAGKSAAASALAFLNCLTQHHSSHIIIDIGTGAAAP